MDNISNDHFHSMRLILETAGAKLAALNARPEEIEHLENILKEMSDTTLKLNRRILLDADFHISIARASGNELLEMFVDVMTLLLKDYMSKGFFGVTRIRNTLNQHKKILEAIKAGRGDEAEAAIYAHLVAARKDVSKYENSGEAKKTKKGKTASAADKRR
jgi:GntR family transcriptional repressor for pyruvate dehydrogenase complex